MEVITIESKAFKEIASKLDAIYEHVSNSRPLLYAFSDSEIWVDSQEVSDMLNISVRTLQRLRAEGELSYTYVRRRCRYKVKDICKLLDDKTIPCTYERMMQFKQKYALSCVK